MINTNSQNFHQNGLSVLGKIGIPSLFVIALHLSQCYYCRAQEVFVSGQLIEHFEEVNGTVFWSADCQALNNQQLPTGIHRKPGAGGQMYNVLGGSPCVNDDRVWSLGTAADANAIYWINASGQIIQQNWDGRMRRGIAQMETLLLSPVARPSVVVSDTHVYWAEHLLTRSQEFKASSKIFRTSKSAPHFRHLVLDLKPKALRKMEADGKYLFLLYSTGDLVRLDVSNGYLINIAKSVRTFTITPQKVGNQVKRRIYWSSDSVSPAKTEIYTAPLSQVTLPALAYRQGQSWPISAMVLNRNGVLTWYEHRGVGGGPLMSQPLSGGKPRILVSNVPQILGDLVTDGRFVFWQQEKTQIHRVGIDPKTFFVDIGDIRMEIVQAVQNSSNDVPLVSGKPTYVRVFGRLVSASNGITKLDSTSPSAILRVFESSPLTGKKGRELDYFGDFGLTPYPLGSQPQEFTAALPNRDRIDDSIWFRLPDTWTKNAFLLLEVTVNPHRVIPEIDYKNNSATAFAVFNSQPPVSLQVVTSYFTSPESGKFLFSVHPDKLFHEFIERELALLPTSKLQFKWNPAYIGKTSPYALKDDSKANSRLLKKLKGLHGYSQQLFAGDKGLMRTMTFSPGVRDATQMSFAPWPPGFASGIPGTSFWSKYSVNANTSWNRPWGALIFAHEIGHTMGLSHVSCGFNTPFTNPNFPYQNECWISGPLKPSHGGGVDDGIGWDWITETLIPGSQAADFMTYQSPQWVSGFSWEHFMNQIRKEGATAAAKAMEAASNGSLAKSSSRKALLRASLTITEKPTAEMENSYIFPDEELVNSFLYDRVRETDNSFLFVARDRTGTIMSIANPWVEVFSESEHGEKYLEALIDYRPEISTITLLDSEFPKQPLAVIRGESQMPRIEISVPNFEPTGGGIVEFQWDVVGEASDSLTFIVRYSNNGGETWQALATDTTKTTLEVNGPSLPGGQNCKLQILASNGVHSTVTESELFTIPDKKPNVSLVMRTKTSMDSQLVVDGLAIAGMPIHLSALATDTEDGVIDSSKVKWEVKGPKNYDFTGDRLYLPGLLPGDYEIEVRAKDSLHQEIRHRSNLKVWPATIRLSEKGAMVDGLLDNRASMPDSPRLFIRNPDRSIAKVSVTTWQGKLQLEVAGLPYGLDGERDRLELYIDHDGNGGEHPDSQDQRIVVFSDGEFRNACGSEGGWADAFDGQHSPQVRVSEAMPGFWNVEASIALPAARERLGWQGVRIGIRYQDSASSWPSAMQSRVPDSWGRFSVGEWIRPMSERAD